MQNLNNGQAGTGHVFGSNIHLLRHDWSNCNRHNSCNSQGFWYFAQSWSREIQVNPRNPAKFTKNTMKFGRNLIKYMSVQQFWNLSQLLGVFTCRKLNNLCQNCVTEMCKQHSETSRCRLCCKKLGTSHDVKGFAIGSFLEGIVVERANDDLC